MGMKKHDHSGSQKGGGKDGRHRRTAAQRRSQQGLTQCSQGWNDLLTEEQRIAWRRLAETLPRRVRNGRFYRLRGHQVFRAINMVLTLLAREPRTDPPPEPKFGVNPRVTLRIKGTSRVPDPQADRERNSHRGHHGIRLAAVEGRPNVLRRLSLYRAAAGPR